MHELSVCQALLTQIAEVADRQGARTVERITIEWGPLCGVEPSLLVNAFAIMRQGSVASGAELNIVPIGVSVSCRTCGAVSDARANHLACGACGGFRTRVVAGDELRLRQIEMQLLHPRQASMV